LVHVPLLRSLRDMAAKNLPRTVTHSQKIEVVVKITHKVQ
jgi:hypothetical protein